MKLVVAVDREWGIGNNGELLARVRGDLLNFKNLTLNKTVILGSKTLATFPKGRPLKNRNNIVMSRSPEYFVEGAEIAHSTEELQDKIKELDTNDVFVIGGESIYKQLLPFCDTAYVTKFDRSYEKDAFFPNLDEMPEWKKTKTSEIMTSDAETDSEAGLKYVFCEYKRV